VRAENLVRGSDQQSCRPGRPAVMITDHVPAVRLPPDHGSPRGCALSGVRRRGDPAPPAAPPEAELGGPGLLPALLSVIPNAPSGAAAAVTPDTILCAGTATSSAAAGPMGAEMRSGLASITGGRSGSWPDDAVLPVSARLPTLLTWRARGDPCGCRKSCHPRLTWDSCIRTDLGRTAAGPTSTPARSALVTFRLLT
jgi:hypothetical protein